MILSYRSLIDLKLSTIYLQYQYFEYYYLPNLHINDNYLHLHMGHGHRSIFRVMLKAWTTFHWADIHFHRLSTLSISMSRMCHSWLPILLGFLYTLMLQELPYQHSTWTRNHYIQLWHSVHSNLGLWKATINLRPYNYTNLTIYHHYIINTSFTKTVIITYLGMRVL